MAGRRDPFKEIEELFEQLNAGFADVGRDLGEEFTERTGRGIHVDVADADDDIVVVADVPGFDAEEIDVSVKDRTLHITAEHGEEETAEEEAEETHYYRRERTKRAATRSVRLPTEVDESGADATYENGVLTVTLPKAGDDEGGIDIQVN